MFPHSALEALINFAYSGHVAIDQQNVQSLLIGSSFLQLQNVKDACCSFLQERSVTQPTQCYFCLLYFKNKIELFLIEDQ